MGQSAGIHWKALGTASVLASALVLSACGKDDQPAPAPAPSASAAPEPAAAAAPTPQPSEHHDGSDVMKWLQMSPDKAKEVPKEPVKEAAPKPAPVAVASLPSKPASVSQPPAARAEAPATAPAPSPAPVASPAPAPVVVAAAPSPAAAAKVLKVISREQPSFPRDALREGVHSGQVSARLTVGPDGSVTHVDIIASNPRRVFDKAVIAAASRWKYAPLGETETAVAEFDFNADNN